jgi:exopolysaccharide biosynthesis protein
MAASSATNAFPYFENAGEIAARTKALVVVNGGYFIPPSGPPGKASAAKALGFFYVDGNQDFQPFPGPGRFPVLGIERTPSGQDFQIAEKTAALTAPDWKLKDGKPILADHAGPATRDATYAVQCDPILLREDGTAPERFAPDHYQHWARTAVGIDQSGNLLLLVADGEGLHGCQGASMPQMSSFFKDVLRARTAMNLDGGGSTQLVLREEHGPRLINTLTAEHPRWLPNGRVHNYLIVERFDF